MGYLRVAVSAVYIRYLNLKSGLFNTGLPKPFSITNVCINIHRASPTDAGALLIDGLGDGIMISSSGVKNTHALRNSISFGTLQASRVRISKTEYISCPSCGRTLFDLQETTAKIRKVTDHLKGIKIGIMGCIVNGPGEMADADYGYVGTGKDKIALYKGQNVIKKSVPAHLEL